MPRKKEIQTEKERETDRERKRVRKRLRDVRDRLGIEVAREKCLLKELMRYKGQFRY